MHRTVIPRKPRSSDELHRAQLEARRLEQRGAQARTIAIARQGLLP